MDQNIENQIDAADEAPPEDSAAGRLSIVGIPESNNRDITVRALGVLQQADVIVCGNFKRTAQLLRDHKISRRVAELEGGDRTTADSLIDEVVAGKSVAVVSSDGAFEVGSPAELLSRLAHERGIQPKILPGPSSIVGGLLTAGFAFTSFEFHGVLPRLPQQRRDAAHALVGRTSPVVLRESPHRLRSLLDVLAEAMPERPAALVMNLSLPFESIFRGTLRSIRERMENKRARGSVLIVLGEYSSMPDRPRSEILEADDAPPLESPEPEEPSDRNVE
jgi:16S rRNA (cytidine1402-2'-O)-methyltransferase